jgi:MFS family permease
VYAFVPQFVQTPAAEGYGFGASIATSGLLLLPLTAGIFVMGVSSGGLARRFGPRNILMAGMLTSVAPLVVLAVVNDHQWEVLVGTALVGCGLGLVQTSIPGAIAGAVPPQQTGAALGMNTNFRLVGSAVGVACVSSIIASSAGSDGLPSEAGYAHGFLLLAVAMLIAAPAALLVPDSWEHSS